MARTSIGALMFTLAGFHDAPERVEALRFLKTNKPSEFGDSYVYYAKYYRSQAMFHADSATWQAWNAENIRDLQAAQSPDGGWHDQFGEVTGTSFALLSIALNYRFLPIYERNLPGPAIQMLK